MTPDEFFEGHEASRRLYEAVVAVMGRVGPAEVRAKVAPLVLSVSLDQRDHCLSAVEEKAWAVARSKAPAAQRMERLILEILAYHRENLVTEQRVNELVVVAIERSWDTIRAHKDVMRNVTELILRDGIAAGEFEAVDPRETADLIMRSVVAFTHPLIVGQCLEEGEDLEAQARASVRFLLRAIMPR